MMGCTVRPHAPRHEVPAAPWPLYGWTVAAWGGPCASARHTWCAATDSSSRRGGGSSGRQVREQPGASAPSNDTPEHRGVP